MADHAGGVSSWVVADFTTGDHFPIVVDQVVVRVTLEVVTIFRHGELQEGTETLTCHRRTVDIPFVDPYEAAHWIGDDAFWAGLFFQLTQRRRVVFGEVVALQCELGRETV
ncbi:hypothetical protein D3C81_1850720 [compost metagenome]